MISSEYDWCIPQHDAYRIMDFVGPDLAGLWPGPPAGWRGVMPGRSPVVLRRVPPMVGAGVGAGGAAVVSGGVAAAPAVVVAGCAQCGTSAVKLMQCTRCRAASYCSSKCQKLHYPAHKAGCRAAASAAAAAAISAGL